MLMKLINEEETLAGAAAKAGMDEKTARKWRDSGMLPSQGKVEHTWRTKPDPFEEVWEEVRARLTVNPGFEAKTLFEDLQRRYPERFSDGQIRSLQRRIKAWRALEGPQKEVFFPQVHDPGKLCESDFTRMGKLEITIQGQFFDHLVYHFVLSYSNWETGMVCFSESFESLSEGLQSALWQLGGVPKAHRTDRLSTAVHKADSPEEFTQRYRALLKHYDIDAEATNAESPNENGDVEQRHHRFKKALDQALLLRGNRDFASREEYGAFLKKLFAQLNAGRRERFKDDLEVLKPLPAKRLEACKRLKVKVGPSSTVRVLHNVYSVDSRLIGETVEVRLYMEHLEIWYAQRLVDKVPRVRGAEKHRIEYRHIIDWLLRKPGAFENYRYREDLFPSHRFRMAYDLLGKNAKAYLALLNLAAKQGEARVDDALRVLLEKGEVPDAQSVERLLASSEKVSAPTEVEIAEVDLGAYDSLLTQEAACGN
jgi:transposase